MNCHYCHKLCLRIDDNFHRCCHCFADFHDTFTFLSTRIKNVTWVVQLYHAENDKYKAVIGNAREPAMIKLHHDPQVTPQNIQSKLKTYLTFY